MKTLRELLLTDKPAAMEVLNAVANRICVERHANGTWSTRDGGSIHLDCVYRVPPRQSSVDWSQVGVDIVAFMTDQDGDSYAFVELPVPEVYRLRSSAAVYQAHLWPSFVPGNMPWAESMITRPK